MFRASEGFLNKFVKNRREKKMRNNKSFCISSGILIMRHFFSLFFLHFGTSAFFFCFHFDIFINVCVCMWHILYVQFICYWILLVNFTLGNIFIKKFKWMALLCAYHLLHFFSMPYNTRIQVNFHLAWKHNAFDVSFISVFHLLLLFFLPIYFDRRVNNQMQPSSMMLTISFYLTHSIYHFIHIYRLLGRFGNKTATCRTNKR